MIHYSAVKGEGRIECDGCGDDEDFSGDDFRDFVSTAKSAGWEVTKTKEGWAHQCRTCKVPF